MAAPFLGQQTSDDCEMYIFGSIDKLMVDGRDDNMQNLCLKIQCLKPLEVAILTGINMLSQWADFFDMHSVQFLVKLPNVW